MNRMTQAVTQVSTSTYAYDFAGNRVNQTVGSTTTIYPNKYYSITSTTNSGTTYATTTVYVWNGDALIATIDQPMVNGAATGTAATRYFLPDQLNSTNVVTDASGSPIEIVDYYPYGSTRIDQTTNNFRENKQFVGQYSDPETNLSYLQARYYDGSKGEFLSEDPVFRGDPKQQVLTDPQSLNSYSYANDNPINRSDPDSRAASLSGILSSLKSALGMLLSLLTGGGATAQGGARSMTATNLNVSNTVQAKPAGGISLVGGPSPH